MPSPFEFIGLILSVMSEQEGRGAIESVPPLSKGDIVLVSPPHFSEQSCVVYNYIGYSPLSIKYIFIICLLGPYHRRIYKLRPIQSKALLVVP